jgi:hypothetical protein
MATRGWTSRAASSDPQDLRVPWTVIRRTLASLMRRSKLRVNLRGSIGVPKRVVNTNPASVQRSPACSRAVSCCCLRSLRAVTHRSGRGSGASEGCSFPELGGGYGVADLVVGRCLVEKKTVFDPAAAMDNWLNQVLAYVLLDWGDALGVDTISAYLGWQALRDEPSLVVLASAPSRNNPVRGGVLLTGAAGEMPAGWVSGESRQIRLRSRWRRYPGSWAMAR